MTTTLPVTYGKAPRGRQIDAAASPGLAHLLVSDLKQSVAFYSEVIGLSVLALTEKTAHLGTAEDRRVLLELEYDARVKPITGRSRLGLYHTAFRLPNRLALASFAKHIAQIGVRFGSADHDVSEAFYLVDPDGLSVEVYGDRPQEQWQSADGELFITTRPLDFGNLLAAADHPWRGAPEGTTLGHVHFYIGDLERARQLYCEGLGLTLMTWRYAGALFVAAGTYHHHLGLNVWAQGSPVAGASDARLLYWTFELPTAQEVETVAANLLREGWSPAAVPSTEFAFTDDWGLTVVLTCKQSV